MNHFFRSILTTENIYRCGDMLDWLASEKKFDSWDMKQKKEMTKEMKSLCYFSERHYHTKMQNCPEKANHFVVYMTKTGSECESLIRHIRNGFFHGNAKMRIIKKSKFIEIKDYNKRKSQSAFIVVPVEFLFAVWELFKELEKGNKA